MACRGPLPWGARGGLVRARGGSRPRTSHPQRQFQPLCRQTDREPGAPPLRLTMGVGAIVRTGLAAVVVAAATGAASGAVVAVEAAVPATALRGDATAYDGGVFASLDRRGAGAVAARAGVRAGEGPRPHVRGRRAAAVTWAFLPDLSDEWDGSRMDTAKWRDYNPIWYVR